MNLGVSFAPLVHDYVVWAAFGASVVIAALLLLARSRGALLRAVALGLMVLALANPSFTREDRDPIPSVAAVIVDKSPSQDFGDRNKQTDEARKALIKRLSHIPGLDVRVAEAGQADGENDGTRPSVIMIAPAMRSGGTSASVALSAENSRVHDLPA